MSVVGKVGKEEHRGVWEVVWGGGETCLGVLAAGDRSQDVLVEHLAVVLDEQLVFVVVDCVHTRGTGRG